MPSHPAGPVTWTGGGGCPPTEQSHCFGWASPELRLVCLARVLSEAGRPHPHSVHLRGRHSKVKHGKAGCALLRNLYAGQEATVRTGHGTTDWFQTGKGVRQGCILSPCLFNLYAEYIMRKAALEEAQTGIKIAGRNIN